MKPIFYILILAALIGGLCVYKLAPIQHLGQPLASNVTNSSVTVTSGNTLVLSNNSGRHYARIEMASTSGQRGWCSQEDASVSSAGFMLSVTSGNPLVLDVNGERNPWLGKVFCNMEGFFGNATSVLSVMEY